MTKIFEPDASGNLPDASGNLTVETDFEYDGAGRVTAIKQLGAAGDAPRVRTFTRDLSGQLTSQTSPEQGKTDFTLDKKNRIQFMTDARGVTRHNVYDSQQRLVSKSYSDGSPTTHFRYGTKEHPMFLSYLGEQNGADLQKMERFNQAGAQDGTLQKYLDGSYATGRLVYDAFGRITRIIYPDGRVLHQTWNHKGYLVKIKEGSSDYFVASRYATGDHLLAANLGSDLTLRKAYDASDRLAELAILKGDQVLFGHRYHYNAYGSVDRLDDLTDMTAVDFSYDQLNRVSSFKASGGDARTFSYDAAGSLKNASSLDGINGVDEHNRLQSSAGLTYDYAGEMTFDGAHSYTYNAEDLIASVDGSKVRYVYNAMGDLVERISAKGTEEFLWLSGQLLAKRETDGTWTDFVYVNGQRIASIHKPLPTKKNPEPKDDVTYFVADRVGAARAAVAADGTILAAAIFSPFGKPIGDSPLATAAEAISYSGEVHDSYTGLNIYQYRSYNPRLGRWMSPDPSGLHFADLTNPQTFGLYTFVVDDSMKYFDAHGLYAEDGGDDDGDGDGNGGLGGDGPGLLDDGGGGGGGDDGTCGGPGQIPCVIPVDLSCQGASCPTDGSTPDPNPGQCPSNNCQTPPPSGGGDGGNPGDGGGDSGGYNPPPPGGGGTPNPGGPYGPCEYGCFGYDPYPPPPPPPPVLPDPPLLNSPEERAAEAQAKLNMAKYALNGPQVQRGDDPTKFILTANCVQGNHDCTYTLSGMTQLRPIANVVYTYYIWEHQTQHIATSVSVGTMDWITPPPPIQKNGNSFGDNLTNKLNTYRFFTVSTSQVYDPTKQMPVNIRENGKIVAYEHIYAPAYLGPATINGSDWLQP